MSTNGPQTSRLQKLLQAGSTELEARLAVSTDLDEKLSAALEAAVPEVRDPSPLMGMLRTGEADLQETLASSVDVEQRLGGTLDQVTDGETAHTPPQGQESYAQHPLHARGAENAEASLPESDRLSGSIAYARADLYFVRPDVSASAVVGSLHMPDTLAHRATGYIDAVRHPIDPAVDEVTYQAHDMIIPALIGLTDLSDSLLMTRLALSGTMTLAWWFNDKAAVELEAMARRQMSLEDGSGYWRRAAQTVAGLNARITVLGLDAAGPGDPPLPAPVQPVGVPLDELWRRLAETERALRRAEVQRAARATTRPPFPHLEDPEGASWYDRVREQRLRALRTYAEGGELAAQATNQRRAGKDAALTEDDVLREGAELLAGLPLAFTSECWELIVVCLLETRHAVRRRPAMVRGPLRMAARFARRESERAKHADRARRDAALRLQVLQAATPDGVDPLPEAPAAVGILKRVLRDGAQASQKDALIVQAALAARHDALHRTYLIAALRRAIERWGDGAVHARADAKYWDFAPAAWGGHYWLRVSLIDTDQLRVVTMRKPLPPEEAQDPAAVTVWQHRDVDRCAESELYVRQLSELTKAQGIHADFVWTPGTVVVDTPFPGLPTSRDRRSPSRHSAVRLPHHDDTAHRP